MLSRSLTSHRGRPRAAVLALALAFPALAIPAHADAAPKPDLRVTAVSDPPGKVLVGDGFLVRDTTANRGRRGAAATATRFYLTGDPKRSLRDRRQSRTDPRSAPGDILLAGVREVPALRGGRSSKAKRATAVRVPAGTQPGTYRLLACADDRGAVSEAVEHDNCRPAKHGVTIAVRPDDATTELSSMSDIFDAPDEAEDRKALDLFAQSFCNAQVAAPRMTVPRAIAGLRSALTAQVGADAMRAFAASPEYRSASRAQAASVAALTSGNPGAALAALLRAHDLQPRRAAHLRNAAAVAVSLGHAPEALALLDGAARLDDAPLAGMGISPRTVALTTRGQALGMLGRWNEARPLLQSAMDAEPLLAEATDSLAAATACAKDPAKALMLKRRARNRRGVTPPPPLDLSRGQEHPLRKLVLPFNPQQAAAMRDVYRAESDHLGVETMALVNRRSAAEAALRQEEPTASPASVKRRKAIFSRIYNAHKEPDVAAAIQRFHELSDKPLQTTYDFWGNADQEHKVQQFSDTASQDCQGAKDYTACYDRRMNEQCVPALKIAHQTWVDQVTDTWRAADAAHRLFAKRVSAYGAHLADPQAQALVRVTIEEDELATYGLVRSSFIGWTVGTKMYEKECVNAPEEPAANPEQAGPADSESCPSFLKGVSISAKLDDWTLKVSCEKVELGGSLKAAPWLAGFAKATYDPRAGKMTIFAGSQAQIDTLKVVKGAFRSGVYVTVDSKGIEDVGWRTGPSASAGAGPAEVQLFKDEIDMSFVSGLNATFGR